MLWQNRQIKISRNWGRAKVRAMGLVRIGESDPRVCKSNFETPCVFVNVLLYFILTIKKLWWNNLLNSLFNTITFLNAVYFTENYALLWFSNFSQQKSTIYNNNIASCAIWLWNMVSCVKGGRLRVFEKKILILIQSQNEWE